MADITTVKQLVVDIDTETNAVAAKQDAEIAKIADLQAKLDAGGSVSSADLQGVQDGLQSISDRLKVIGADPAQPIPPPTV